MRTEQLQKIVTQAVALGMIQARSMMLAGQEWITRPQARDYLKAEGLKPGMLDKWEESGILTSHQTGTGGTKKYRRIDLQEAILTASIAILD